MGCSNVTKLGYRSGISAMAIHQGQDLHVLEVGCVMDLTSAHPLRYIHYVELKIPVLKNVDQIV